MAVKPVLGLVVNPIAGMGGSVGLKGTDGADAVARARVLGSRPRSGDRARLALGEIVHALGNGFVVKTVAGEMGEAVAQAVGIVPVVVVAGPADETTAADTQRAVANLVADGVDLLLFAGGDGTARDVCATIGGSVPVLGVPTGVKMHSAAFATHPRVAGQVAARFLAGEALDCHDAEVMDIDEEALRSDRVSARLYGFLRVPQARGMIQRVKSGRGGGEASELAEIAVEMAERMNDGALYLLGPGTTTRAIAEAIGVEKTLVGVDIVYRGEPIVRDASERDLLTHLRDEPLAKIVVTPIGGQGYVFGRGNQQFSAEVIRQVGRVNIIVVATPSKLAALGGEPLLVDTGDPDVDALLSGYMRVVTGRRKETMVRVA
ncbi:MAG: ATP-NAD kinase family protein [Thermomicrobiales bacterium]|nr:ATP-NAD kinase family protein [Thermomicrobiales bacterium]